MKKLVLLFLMGIVAPWAYAAQGDSADDPIDFNWEEGHVQVANTTCWYKVDLTDRPDGYDVLLYLNNVDDAAAIITAQPFVKTSSLTKLNDPVTKSVQPGRNYAMTLSHSAINALSTKVVYVTLTTDKTLRFSAEAVEPGERDLDCLNAVAFERAGTVHNAGTTWYAVDIADLKADPTKTVTVSVTNQGTASAVATAGVSFDCPSTATTDVTRTLAAGQTRSKVIDRALIDMLSVDMLYIQVSSSQPLFIKAETTDVPTQDVPAISGEIDFLLDTQYSLSSGAQWYKVNVKELREAGKDAELTLVNTGNAAAAISADVAFSNPATSVVSRSITLAHGAVLVRDLARNLIESVSDDYAWVRLTTSGSIMFSARLKSRSEGAVCASARVFDWTNGDWQTAETTVWYKVPIKDAKQDAQQRDIMVKVENLSQAQSATLSVQLAFDCPVTGTTDATRSIAAGAIKQKRLEHQLFANLMVDTVYVGLTTTQNIRITAEMVDAIADWSKDCVLSDAVLFDWEQGNDQKANTAVWYKVDLTPVLNSPDTVPEITVTNLGTMVARIAGELAFDCPAAQPTTQRVIEVATGGNYVKTVARDLLETLENNIVYIRVETTQDIHIQSVLKRQNEGLNCVNAIDFDWQNGNLHPAGKTLWYKVPLTDVKNTPNQAVRIGILNNDGTAGAVSANLYFSCDEEAFASYQMTLGAGARRETELGRALIMNVKADTVYIELEAAQADSLYAVFYEEELQEPITACAEALPVEYNTDMQQIAGTQWYYVDVNYLQTYTSGDATLTVTNTSSSAATLTAELAWECPVTERMLDRTVTLGSEKVYTKVATRSLIDNLDSDTAWICVTASQPVTFRVDIIDERGLTCFDPILFDWVNGNTHPADNTLWYRVELDTLKNESPDDLHDFRLNVQNLLNENIAASAEIYFDCMDDALTSVSYDFEANELKWRDIDRDLLETVGWAPLLIKLTSTGDVHLSAELIEPIPDMVIDTLITDTVCKGFTYTAFRDGQYYEYLIETDSVWTDTVRFTLHYDHYTQLVDSVYKYDIKCRVQPDLLPVTVQPLVVAGKAIDVSAATQALMQAFEEQRLQNLQNGRVDEEVVSVSWEVQQQGNTYAPLTDELLDTRTQFVVMRYVVHTEPCQNRPQVSDPAVYAAEAPLTETLSVDTIVCVGTEVLSRVNTVLVSADTVWNDTVYNIVHEEGIQLKDSVYTYNCRVWKEPLVPAWSDLASVPTAQAGAPVDVIAAEQEILSLVAAQAADDVIPVTGLTWQISDAEGNWSDLTDTPVAYDAATLTIRFGLQTDGTCLSDIVWSDATQLAVTPAEVVNAPLVADTVCVGDTYTPEHGEPRLIEEPTEWTVSEYEGTVENRYTYQISVFQPVTLPDALESLPLAVCGQVLHTEDADAALAAALDNAQTDINSLPEETWWEILLGSEWRKLSDSNTPLDSNVDEVTLRYVVRTSCNDSLQSAPLTLAVQYPNADNTPELDNMPAVSKYDDWLLMINLNQINEKGYFPAAEDVMWYRVVGEPDAQDGEQDDELLASGYYYTVAGKLTGDYYALIDIAAGEDNACGATLRTVVLSCAPPQQAVTLSPALVAPGENVELSGLNPQLSYTIEIYGLTGVCIKRMQVSGASAYTFEAQTAAGCYMVNVNDEAGVQTFKFIVK